MQGFLSVLKKIGKGVQTGISVAQKGVQVGKQLGLLEAGAPAAAQGASQEELIALLQQAMPALQALTQSQSQQVH